MKKFIILFLFLIFNTVHNSFAINYDRIMNSLIFTAIENNDKQGVYELLIKGVNLNASLNDSLQTPLHVAAYYGDPFIVKLLIDYKADVNKKAKDDFTALHLASQQGNEEVVSVLIKEGALLEQKNKDSFTALHLASFYNKVSVIEVLLTLGAKVDSLTKEQATPLHVASQNGSFDAVKYLVENGANINKLSPSHGTALHFAVHGNQPKIVEYLLLNGLDPNTMNDTKATPFVWNGYIGSVKIAQLLIDYKANTKLTNTRNFTALHTAAIRGYSDLIEYLMSQKIYNGYERSFNGLLAIHYAAFYGHKKAVQGLIKYLKEGIDVADNQGETVLFYAIQGKQLAMVKYIVEELNPNLNVKPKSRETFKSMAKKVEANDILEYLNQRNIQ